jgi:hypothetical protein
MYVIDWRHMDMRSFRSTCQAGPDGRAGADRTWTLASDATEETSMYALVGTLQNQQLLPGSRTKNSHQYKLNSLSSPKDCQSSILGIHKRALKYHYYCNIS